MKKEPLRASVPSGESGGLDLRARVPKRSARLSRVVFSSGKDNWRTPKALFDALDDEFHFAVDIAASRSNALCAGYFGRCGLQPDGLKADFRKALRAVEDGTGRRAFWCNPPYSRRMQGKFIAKAATERFNGHTTVMLIPARTDTRAFHFWIWNHLTQQPRPGVEVRFLPGRIKFVGAKHGAPFPSMVVIFRPLPDVKS